MRIRIWDNTPDQKGDVIKVNTIDLSRYEQNPVLMYRHDGYVLPIGNVVNLEKTEDGLYGDLKFDLEEDDYLGKILKKKYEKGVMRGVSPRFFAYEETPLPDGGRLFGRAELVEVSLVTLPSHKNAVVLNKNLGDDLPEGAVELNPFTAVDLKLELQTESEMKELFKSLGLAADEANEAKAINVVTDLKKNLATAEAAGLAKDQEIKDLKKQLTDKDEEARQKEVDALLDGAVTAKKITAGEREPFKELCKSVEGFESVKKIIDSRPAAPSLSAGLEAGSATDLNKNLSERADWNYLKWMKEDPAGLEQMKQADSAKFQELLKGLDK